MYRIRLDETDPNPEISAFLPHTKCGYGADCFHGLPNYEICHAGSSNLAGLGIMDQGRPLETGEFGPGTHHSIMK